MISSNIHLHEITRKTADALLALQPLLADADDFTAILLGHPFLFQWSAWTVLADKSKKQPQASVKTFFFFANWQHFAVSITHF